MFFALFRRPAKVKARMKYLLSTFVNVVFHNLKISHQFDALVGTVII